jgi:hypothetical protein
MDPSKEVMVKILNGLILIIQEVKHKYFLPHLLSYAIILFTNLALNGKWWAYDAISVVFLLSSRLKN